MFLPDIMRCLGVYRVDCRNSFRAPDYYSLAIESVLGDTEHYGGVDVLLGRETPAINRCVLAKSDRSWVMLNRTEGLM